jgi:hypothetical protein
LVLTEAAELFLAVEAPCAVVSRSDATFLVASAVLTLSAFEVAIRESPEVLEAAAPTLFLTE